MNDREIQDEYQQRIKYDQFNEMEEKRVIYNI